MGVLRPTTTISVRRGTAEHAGTEVDPWDVDDREWDADTTVIAAGISAAFTSPQTTPSINGGVRTEVRWKVIVDPCDVIAGDVIVDERAIPGRWYQVGSVLRRPGIMPDHDGAGSLDHIVLDVVEIIGAV